MVVNSGAWSRRPIWIAALVFYLCAAGLSASYTLSRLNIKGEPGAPAYGLQDFRDAVYFPAVAFLDGVNPYDEATYKPLYPVNYGFPVYAPHYIAVNTPFALLPHAQAERVYLVYNLALLAVFAWVIVGAAGLAPNPGLVFALAGVMALSRSGQLGIFLGQSMVMFSIGIAAAVSYARTRPWVSAAGLTVAMMKPTFGVPLSFLLLARGEWRTVARAAVMTLLVAGPVLLLLVSWSGGPLEFVASIQSNVDSFASRQAERSSAAVLRIDQHHLAAQILGAPLSSVGNFVLTVSVFGACCFAAFVESGDTDGDGFIPWVWLASLSMLSPFYHHSYDALLVFFPMVVLFAARAEHNGEGGSSFWLVIAALAAVPLVNYGAIDSVVGRLGWTSTPARVVATLNAAALAGALALLLSRSFGRTK